MNTNYMTTRIKGMRSRLLTDTDYQKLIHQPSVDSLSNYLSRTSYHEHVQSIYTISNPVETLRKVFSCYLKDQMDSIKKTMVEPYSDWITWKLRRWDLLNIKKAIRLVKNPLKSYQRKNNSRMLHQCLPSADFDDNDLKELFSLEDLNELKKYLISKNSPFYKVIDEIDDNDFSKGIINIDNRLNNYYFSQMLNSARKTRAKSMFKLSKENPLLKMTQEEIDFENIKIALRWIRANKFEPSSATTFAPDGIFIPGGQKFNAKTVSNYLEEGNFDKVVKLVNRFTGYDIAVNDVYKDMEVNGEDYESELERTFLRSQIKKKYLFRKKLNVVISYYYSLLTEFTNLATIMYGINGRIDPQIIAKKVIANA